MNFQKKNVEVGYTETVWKGWYQYLQYLGPMEQWIWGKSVLNPRARCIISDSEKLHKDPNSYSP